jgi:glycosyltransferase involved in cell wall biosynthesis
MDIALFHNLPSGGAKRAVYEWTKRLAKKHSIDVYTLSTADHDFCDIRPFVNDYKIIQYKPRGLFHSPLGRLNQLQRWRDLGDLIDVGRGIALKIDAGDYDVVFANTCRYTYIPTFLQFVKTPSIYYLHEPFGAKFKRYIQRPYLQYSNTREIMDRVDPLIKLYNHRLEKTQQESVERTGKLLANSAFTKELMEGTYGKDTPVCHYGVDTKDFLPVPEISKDGHILSVGELSPRKGFNFLIESLAHIPREYRPELKLACNTIDYLEKDYIESLGGEKDVDLDILENLDTQELMVEYNKARICVYTPILEPFGLVPLEAMSCGTPVVGVCEGGVKESIIHERTGLLVERDVKKFSNAVQHLISNPDLAAEYGRNGREHVLRNWTWDRSVDRLEDHLVAC